MLEGTRLKMTTRPVTVASSSIGLRRWTRHGEISFLDRVRTARKVGRMFGERCSKFAMRPR